MGKKKPAAWEEGGAGKSRKKAVVTDDDDDEYSIGTELSEEKSVQGEEQMAPVAGKKGNQKSVTLNDDAEDVDEGDENLEVQFTGKKKSKSKGKKGGNSFAASAFALLGDEDAGEASEVTEDEEEDVSEQEDAGFVFSGKKKSSKSKKGGNVFTSSVFDAIGDDDDDVDEPVISFTGKKKKSSKSNKKPSGSVFSMLDDGENEKESEDVSVSGLSGVVDDDDDDDSSVIKFSGKKKPSKKTSNAVDEGECEQPSTSVTSKEPEVSEPSKNKKKKGGRTAQEEDDLDKILAELGSAPAPAPPTPTAAPPALAVEGVYVQASTLGSLEALLEFLKTPAVSIPVSGIGIGPVHKKDVMKASVMLEKKKEYATILAFDVKVTPEAREHADDIGVKIFTEDIIYHLFDQFTAYIDNLKEEKKKEAAEDAVFPCVLQIMPNCVFNKKDPIILGVDVIEGILKIGTPICVPQRGEFIDIGRISSIENNHKPVEYAKKGQKVAIKITGSNAEEQQKMFGRHFEMEDELVSRISRNSIDVLKANYRDELSNEEWKLVVKLKHLFKIQ